MDGAYAKGKSMTQLLADAVSDYELATEITLKYANQLRYAVGRFSRYLRRPATVDDLNAKLVNSWLKDERDKGQIADRTRANYRRSLLTIWQHIGTAGFNRSSIRSVVVTPKNPEAWDYAELEKVTAAAAKLPGRFKNGIARSLYMPALLWFAYETGLRRGDVWSFDLQQFDASRRAAMTQSKVRRVHVIEITAETEADLRKISEQLKSKADPHWKTPLRWPQSERQFYEWMKRCRLDAGVDPEVRNRALQHIRRTGATEVAAEGMLAWQFLGHSREGLDRKSYVDARRTVASISPSRNRSHGRERTA
jgi:integrase